MSLPLDKEHSITLSLTGQPTRSLTVGQGAARALEWVANMEECGEELSDTTRSTLEEVKENCTTLDELDPDNKCRSFMCICVATLESQECMCSWLDEVALTSYYKKILCSDLLQPIDLHCLHTVVNHMSNNL